MARNRGAWPHQDKMKAVEMIPAKGRRRFGMRMKLAAAAYDAFSRGSEISRDIACFRAISAQSDLLTATNNGSPTGMTLLIQINAPCVQCKAAVSVSIAISAT